MIPEDSVAKLYFDTNCPPLPYQMLFLPDERSYLENKCYLDCSEIYEDDYSRILNQLIKTPGACIGQMNDHDLVLVKTQIKIARTIPTAVKIKYGIV